MMMMTYACIIQEMSITTNLTVLLTSMKIMVYVNTLSLICAQKVNTTTTNLLITMQQTYCSTRMSTFIPTTNLP